MSEVKVNTRWLSDLNQKDPEAKERRVQLVTGGGALLEVLGNILLSEIKSLDKTEVEDYDTPNWALREADRKGQIRFARKMLDLIRTTNG